MNSNQQKEKRAHVVPFRATDTELRWISELQDAFFPWAKNRSETLQRCVELVYSFCICGMKIPAILGPLQQIQRALRITNSPSEESSAVSAATDGAGSVSSPMPSRPRVFQLKSAAVNRRRYFHCPEAAVLGMAWGTSFLSNGGRVFAGGQVA